MSKFDELLASVTDEHGIPADFIEGARLAYDEDISALQAEHTAALESLGTAHAAELETVRNDAFDSIKNGEGDNFPATVGDETIDENLDFDTFWEEAE